MKSDTERLERARLAYVVLAGDIYRLQRRNEVLAEKQGHAGPERLPDTLVNHFVELGFAIGSFEGQDGAEMRQLRKLAG